MKSLRNVKRVELVRIPVLVVCVIPSAFKCVEDVKMENAGLLEKMKEMKEAIERKKREEEERRRREEEERRKREEEERRKREEEERRRKGEEERRRRQEEERRRRQEEEERRRKEEEERKRKEAEEAAKRRAMISCKRDWDRVDKRVVESIEVSDGCCNEVGLMELDLRGFVNLKELKVGNECFMYVNEVKLIGLGKLESVCIGIQSLTRIKSVDDLDREKDPWDQIDHNRHFYLKNCPKLKLLKFGYRSCLDYSVCEIENVDALEVIEMGDCSFLYASLELKSVLIHSE